jgi:hypothetical protein
MKAYLTCFNSKRAVYPYKAGFFSAAAIFDAACLTIFVGL